MTQISEFKDLVLRSVERNVYLSATSRVGMINVRADADDPDQEYGLVLDDLGEIHFIVTFDARVLDDVEGEVLWRSDS